MHQQNCGKDRARTWLLQLFHRVLSSNYKVAKIITGNRNLPGNPEQSQDEGSTRESPCDIRPWLKSFREGSLKPRFEHFFEIGRICQQGLTSPRKLVGLFFSINVRLKINDRRQKVGNSSIFLMFEILVKIVGQLLILTNFCFKGGHGWINYKEN